jgi:glycine cleavage system regulatory protein
LVFGEVTKLNCRHAHRLNDSQSLNLMNTPHAVILLIAEKNCSVDELNKFISLLHEKHDFSLLDEPSFNSDRTHIGTMLIKSVKGNDADKVIELIKKELGTIKSKTMVKFSCRLTVAATKVATEALFI